jgi:hypothetical protein
MRAGAASVIVGPAVGRLDIGVRPLRRGFRDANALMRGAFEAVGMHLFRAVDAEARRVKKRRGDR